jgi:hypothetical protein
MDENNRSGLQGLRVINLSIQASTQPMMAKKCPVYGDFCIVLRD